MTNKPINANDEDLVDGMERVGQPMDQPTSMSYCLQRYRLAELCRELTDSEPFPTARVRIPPYERIRDIDSKMTAFVNGLPPFFSLDYETADLPDTDPRRSVPITVQRYILNFLVHTQRCRLHLPYLTRSAKDPKYLYSKDACLEAARMVIRTERQLSTENLPFVLIRLKSSAIMHCVCMAIIVLLMDVCLSKSQYAEDDRERRMEIFNAFTVLEEAKGQSPFPEKILESFYSVLQRYKIPFVSTEENDQPNRPALLNPQMISVALPESAADGLPFDPTLPSFNDLWETFDANVDPTTLDWNTLFAELESPFISI